MMKSPIVSAIIAATLLLGVSASAQVIKGHDSGAPVNFDAGNMELQDRAALARIAAYVGLDPHFASLAEAEAYTRSVSAPFGPLPDADQRRRLIELVG